MANKVIVTKNKLNNIGDAIRNQLNSTAKYTLDEMPEAIRVISHNEDKGVLTTGFVCNFGIIPNTVIGVLYE